MVQVMTNRRRMRAEIYKNIGFVILWATSDPPAYLSQRFTTLLSATKKHHNITHTFFIAKIDNQ